jgi:hypothetical protein
MSLKCGIIGIANTGKTTLFNCMSGSRAETSNYAFGANKSNLGVVNVPDPRLDKLTELVKPKKKTPATVEIIDIPGLTKGSSKGEGVGNQFLADIRNCDALIHVLRCFDDDNLPHVDGPVNPVRDKETVDLELCIKDMESVEKKIQRLEKLVKVGDKEAKQGIESMNKLMAHLEEFQPARTAELNEKDRRHMDDLFLLTDIPVIYVCNVDEASAVDGNEYVGKVKDAVKGEDTLVLTIAAGLEAEIAELDSDEEKAEFLTDYGLKEPGVNRLVRAAYDLLNLQSFFTAGPTETRAWTIRKGKTAPEAAGEIHSDLERGFIKAEVITFDDYVQYGSENAVKEAGKYRVEGKSYVVQDGDVMFIRFNV